MMISKSGIRVSGFGKTTHGSRRPTAFTLVELLVTITIIGILASMIIGASAMAMGQARQARTEALVTRLHTLLSQHYDSFRNRRVEVQHNPREVSNYSGRELAFDRLFGTREQLKMELPDRWSDITLKPVPATPIQYDLRQPPAASNGPGLPTYLSERPAMSRMFLRRYNQAVASGATHEQLLANQGAECLYMIIMLAAGDGESAGLFNEADIGDVDGDGAPEFIDSWGNAIQFLRWAPGFDSEIQLNANALKLIENDPPPAPAGQGNSQRPLTPQAALQWAVVDDRDPFDLFRMDRFNDDQTPRGYRLIPLIYSAGADQEFGLRDEPAFVNAASDPFVDLDGDIDNDAWEHLGEFTDRSLATDNIHNHYYKGR